MKKIAVAMSGGLDSTYAAIKLKEQGHILILWTCREDVDGDPTRAYLQDAIDWCAERGLEFHHINENPSADFFEYIPRKIYADLYIDDRALGGTVDWNDIAEYFHVN